MVEIAYRRSPQQNKTKGEVKVYKRVGNTEGFPSAIFRQTFGSR